MTEPDMRSDAARWREIDALLERSAKLQLYVMFCTTVAPARLMDHLADHVRWVISQEVQGRIFLAGPVAPADAGRAIDSILVLRAADLDQARRIAADDPLVREGVVTFEVREWTVFEGALGFTVSLSGSAVRMNPPR